MPILSVVMPTHNRTTFLAEALESALAQTLDDFEIVISDSSTGDAIAEIVAGYDDARIGYHRFDPDTGPLENWRNAIELARAPLVASLHDDDRWEPAFLERVTAPLLEDPTLAMAFCDYWVMDGESRRQPEQTEIERATSHRDRLPAGPVAGSLIDRLRVGVVWNAPQPAYAAVLRRDAILSVVFPPGMDLLYDIWATYSFVTAGHGLFYVDQRLTNYRVHGHNITAKGFAEPEDQFFATVIADHGHDPAFVAEVEARWGDLQWGRATAALARGDYPKARQYFAGAADHVGGRRATVAGTAARSTPVLVALRGVKVGALRLRSLRKDDAT